MPLTGAQQEYLAEDVRASLAIFNAVSEIKAKKQKTPPTPKTLGPHLSERAKLLGQAILSHANSAKLSEVLADPALFESIAVVDLT